MTEPKKRPMNRLYARPRQGWSDIHQPGTMSELTFKRILLQRLRIQHPPQYNQPREQYEDALLQEVSLTRKQAHIVLKP